MYRCVTRLYYHLMEHQYLLDATNEIHLFAFRYVL